MPGRSRKISQLRIIGGEWRGRKLAFASAPGLRPTTDRVRETLFNWLAMDVPGARCLDLFAGSGALGFEAASRGAKNVVMVESEFSTVNQLKQQVALLKATNIEVVHQVAEQYLAHAPAPFDVVFLDPPFGQPLLEPVLALLAQGWLQESSVIYIETEKQCSDMTIQAWLPHGFEIVRSKQAGEVGYRLARHV